MSTGKEQNPNVRWNGNEPRCSKFSGKVPAVVSRNRGFDDISPHRLRRFGLALSLNLTVVFQPLRNAYGTRSCSANHTAFEIEF